MAQTQQVGQRGERLAVAHLQQHGYTVVVTNWRCKVGEIDIVARQDAVFVFAEVRARSTPTTEAAFASVDARKQTRMQRAVYHYLAAHNLDEVT